MRTPAKQSLSSVLRVGTIACSLCSGCVDQNAATSEKDELTDTKTQREAGTNGEDANAGDAGGRKQAVVVGILTRGEGDIYQTYLMAGPDVPSGKLDTSAAIELPDTLLASNGEAVFVGDNEAISFKRYDVEGDYSLRLNGEFSLQLYGVDYINNDPLFFSATRAFYVDAPRGQIIEFNPSTMEITGDIQVPEILREGYNTWMGPPQRVGNRYLATLLYTDDNWTATAPDSTVGIIVSDDADEPIRVLRDDRGVGSYLSFVGDDGHFYFAADGLSGNLELTDAQDVPSSRLLRVRAGEDAIDPSFLLDLGDLLDTPATFGLWPLPGNAFVTQAWASDVDPSDVGARGRRLGQTVLRLGVRGRRYPGSQTRERARALRAIQHGSLHRRRTHLCSTVHRRR